MVSLSKRDDFRFFIIISAAAHTVLLLVLFFSTRAETYITFKSSEIEIRSFKKQTAAQSRKSRPASPAARTQKPLQKTFSAADHRNNNPDARQETFSPDIDKRLHSDRDDLLNEKKSPRGFTPESPGISDKSEETLAPGVREKITAKEGESSASEKKTSINENISWAGSRARKVITDAPGIVVPQDLRGKSGLIKVQIQVDTAGRVVSSTLIQGFITRLDLLALANARKYRFEPLSDERAPNKEPDKGEITYIFRKSQ